MSDFKSQYAQGYEAGTLDAYHAKEDELTRLKAENNRLTAELEQQYESYNLLLLRFRHLLQSDFIRSFDEYDRIKGDYKRDIKEADMIINRIRAERSRQGCPFGDDRETCAFYKANGCDFCKLAIK